MIRPKLLQLVIVLFAGLAVGCGTEDKQEKNQPESGDHSGHDHGDHDGGDAAKDAFAGLTGADAKLAKAQKTCPVSDEELGSMGTPIKVMVKGKPVFLCCEGCRKKLLRDPDKYLAKLGN